MLSVYDNPNLVCLATHIRDKTYEFVAKLINLGPRTQVPYTWGLLQTRASYSTERSRSSTAVLSTHLQPSRGSPSIVPLIWSVTHMHDKTYHFRPNILTIWDPAHKSPTRGVPYKPELAIPLSVPGAAQLSCLLTSNRHDAALIYRSFDGCLI